MAKKSNYLVHGEYLRFLLKRNQRFVILMSIAMLVLFPILYVTTLNLSEYQNVDFLRVLGQVFNLILLIVSAFLLPIILFDYLNHKKDLDVYHALPIKQNHLLMIHALASLILMWIPFTISWWIGNALSLSINFSVYDVLISYLSSLSVSFMIISLVTFALMHVGTALDGLLYAALLNILPLLVYLSYNLFRSIIFLGFNNDFSLRVIGIMFPIWSLFENVYGVETSYFQNALVSAAYWLGLGSVLYFVSQKAYQVRQHEKAESAFTNTYFYPVVSFVFMVIVIFILYGAFYSSTSSGYLNYYNPLNFVFPFFFAGVIYVVMDTISQRNFKNLFKAMLRYVVIAVIGFSLLLTGLLTKGFGYVTYVPEIDQIESITLDLDDYIGLVIPYNYSFEQYFDTINEVVVTDASGIETLVNFHQSILKEYAWVDYASSSYYGDVSLIEKIESSKDYVPSYTAYPFEFSDNLNMNSMRISMVYTLKDGKTIARSYNVPYAWTYELYDLYESESIISYTARSLDRLDTYPSLKQASLRVFGNDTLTLIDDLDLDKLKEVYLKDVALFSVEDFRDINGPLIATLNLITENKKGEWFESEISLSSTTPNTLAYLESLIPFPEVGESYQEAYLILKEDDDSLLFHRASNQTQYIDYGESSVNRYSYVELTPELLKAIYPYTAYTGFSKEALMAVRVLHNTDNNITLDDYYYYGNYLIKAEYEDEVLNLIKDLDVQINTDIYNIMPK